MSLVVRYRGGTAERGRMDAGELGAAIMGLGDMMKGAAGAVHNDEMVVKTEVTADFEASSFAIDFVVVAYQDGMLDPLTIEQVIQLLGLLFGGGGVIGLLFKLRGRRIDKVEITNKKDVSISAGGDVHNITIEQLNVIQHPKFASGLKSVLSPLSDDDSGAKEVQFCDDDGGVRQRIRSEDKQYFQPPVMPDDIVSEDISDATLEVISPSFREGNKWRFAQGTVTFWADIEDDEFLGRVNAGEELFGRGHLLYVKLLTVTTRKRLEVDATRTILEVLRHSPPDIGNQRHLFPRAKDEDGGGEQ